MKTKKETTIRQKNQATLFKEAEARLKVVYWFFAYPSTPFSLNDLVENLDISKTTANRVILSLIDEGFLLKEEIGKVWRITCNLQHPYNLTIKVPYHLSLLYNSGVIDEIYKHFSGAKAIILFGSYRKGDDNEKSDLDIAVEVLDNKPLEVTRLGNLDFLGFRKNVPVNVHVFSRNKIDLNLFANIVNGIILSGFLEARP